MAQDFVTITLCAEVAATHNPLPGGVGPSLRCSCGTRIFGPTEESVAKAWREHLLRVIGVVA